jgi:rifampicin phosphotransferase
MSDGSTATSTPGSRLSLAFDSSESTQDLVGGKGRNLALMTQAGFPVPPGFTVTTACYRLAIEALQGVIGELVSRVDYDNTDSVEAAAAQVRKFILETPIPDTVAEDIRRSYQRLATDVGDPGPYVAVRSSGTAEDLAEASFAGLHDTYLDIKSTVAVLDAVRRCWASMWTGRALSYRNTNGFDHLEASLAVVVQIMVEAETAGVMFTANPLKERTDEILINASWGLGESVVSGMVSPDEYLLDKRDLAMKRSRLGSKESLIKRKPGGGTVHEETPLASQQAFCLNGGALTRLGEMGKHIEQHYQGMPQDIEWAIADGKVYLLQSRPVTGANFAWEEDLEPPEKEEDEANTIWEKSWAEEGLTGANCPLFYTTRGWNYDRGYELQLMRFGLGEEHHTLKHFKYHRGAVYYNTATEKALATYTMIPHARNSAFCWGGTRFIEPEGREEVVNAPFSWVEYLKMVARLQLHPQTSYAGALDYCMEKWFKRASWNPKTFDAAALKSLSDGALVRTIEQWLREELHYCDDINAWFFNLRDAINMLAWLVSKWYKGDNPTAMVELISGAPGETPTNRENKALWEFTQRIRNSEQLSSLFEQHPEQAFFAKLDESEEGRSFLQDYRDFVAEHPHRGHSDRDIYWLRRGENPAVDYRAIQALMTADPEESPQKLEEQTNARRAAVIADVVKNLEDQPLGPLKVQAFKVVLDYVGNFLVERDLERYSYDKHTWLQKLMFIEVGRRLRERGILTGERDFYFLGKNELFDLLAGRTNNMKLIRAKIAGRMKNFDAYNLKEWAAPPYFIKGEPHDPSIASDDPNRLIGLAQSKGTATGIARVVKTLDKINTIQKGEILICHGTDPGWTPAFLIIKAIITETGGVLSHAACLSREYGLPAVQVQNAIQRIPNGATITVDGTTGHVTIDALPEEAD